MGGVREEEISEMIRGHARRCDEIRFYKIRENEIREDQIRLEGVVMR